MSTLELGHLKHLSNGHLKHLSKMESPKVPKVFKVEPRHLSGDNCAYDLEERAAIKEYDGGFSRAEAEAKAVAELPDIPVFLKR